MAEILGVDRHGRAIAARAAIFDLNGTIVLDERLLAGVVSDVLATVGVVVSTAEYFASFAGLSDEPLFRRALGSAGLSAAMVARRWRAAARPARRAAGWCRSRWMTREPVLWGGERFFRDGECVGYTTFGRVRSHGRRRGGAGLPEPRRQPVTPDAVAAGRYTVNVAGADVPAHVSLRSLFDPDRRRVLPAPPETAARPRSAVQDDGGLPGGLTADLPVHAIAVAHVQQPVVVRRDLRVQARRCLPVARGRHRP
jgi:hypothetical protein